MFSKNIRHTLISFLVFRPVIFFENNSTEIWMSYAWFWCISNWLMCYFLFLICSSVAFNFVPFSWEVVYHMPKHYSHWPFGIGPFYISRLPSHHLNIMESPLLPVPSRSVFLGILRKTLGLTLGWPAVQFQDCEELHSLELSLFLQCQEFSWSLRLAILTGWRRQSERVKLGLCLP